MKTNRGVKIKDEHLVATFEFDGVACPIGKFDPDEYPDGLFLDDEWKRLGTEVMQQLWDSKLFTNEQLETIAFMAPEPFLNCIVEK